MWTFRTKILTSFLVLFLLFISGMYALVQISVAKVVRRALSDRVQALILVVQEAPDLTVALQLLKDLEKTFFYRVALLDAEGHTLYDSKTRKLFGPAFDPSYVTHHPEVAEALQNGSGYIEAWSTLFDQKFAYIAERFSYQGKPFVLRLAFPYEPIESLTRDFEIGFTGLTSLVLLTFALITLGVITYLTRPVQIILKAIRPYQQGSVDTLPTVAWPSKMPAEFQQLAFTLNGMRDRIQSQIRDLVQERNEKLALLDSLGEGVIALKAPDLLSFINAAARTMLKVPAAAIPTHWEAPLPASAPLLSMAQSLLLKTIQTRQTHTDTLQLEEPTLQVFQLSCRPIPGENVALLVMQDVTSQAQILRIGRDFVANASHELRTPITIIRGFAETLHEYGAPTIQALHQMTEKIISNCTRMESLIQNLLLLADLENLPPGSLQPVDCQQVCETCLEQLRLMHPKANARLESHGTGPFLVAGNHDLLEMVITNLLNNAVKYSDHAEIRVTILHQPHHVIIQVADQGIGIAPEDLPHIFKRFYRVDKARTRRLGGAGLGLAIVQTILDRHHGSISVESELGKGTTFTIMLPAYQGQGPTLPGYYPM